ncbi:uncharacterized protein DUF2783 [Roseibium hamelinense]|uniref:Uncharacterized protein DUF2783 n=1 Tax=Roseibium hamelinense TaxID=150831 RepID=A0A562SU70_9HYPH|nr:DUF2783 domain-containing protein [Roseibium hamelinense]MTI42546.1 DUF2783 domain-containing protein [Roseibium hamelinense]TWI84812.1 uncharacterized protein DUF2783 [Roseibium hamelinense]
MTKVNTTPNIESPDAFYSDLISAHDGLSREESEALNARLILLMANQIGDGALLRELIELSKIRGNYS